MEKAQGKHPQPGSGTKENETRAILAKDYIGADWMDCVKKF